jgi:hypothetical protein
MRKHGQSACVSVDLLAGDWSELGEWERRRSIELARRAGRRAARWYLQTSTRGSGASNLRHSRWARDHPEARRLEGPVLLLYARAQTVPAEHDYIFWVVERFAPECSHRWWARARADRLADPRVCSFCDGYERERRRLLGMEPLPVREAGLCRDLAEAKERERESGRAWLVRLTAAREEETDTQRAIAQWEYRRSVLSTDLAQMLLTAATCRRVRMIAP